MQLMQNFLLRLNVFPPFNGLMERRLAIYTTRTPVETFTAPKIHPAIALFTGGRRLVSSYVWSRGYVASAGSKLFSRNPDTDIT